MKQEVTFYDFAKAFSRYNREDNFSPDGLQAIYDYLNEQDSNYELNVIEICCDFTEYKSFGEFKKTHNVETIEELQALTEVMELDNGGIVILDY